MKNADARASPDEGGGKRCLDGNPRRGGDDERFADLTVSFSSPGDPPPKAEVMENG